MYKLPNTLTLALSLKGEGMKYAPPLRGGVGEVLKHRLYTQTLISIPDFDLFRGSYVVLWPWLMLQASL